ncbi:MAG: MobA/MobL family protein [Oscillospiraceae bacterium]|nr:MobA/MobL family protein [Oscillospiraceae bacterium]
MLPAHAPPEFANREIFWNSVEEIEKSSTGQLATMVKAPKVQEIIGTMQRPVPKLQWEETGLTSPCLSCHARCGKLSAGPLIAAFDLRRLKHWNKSIRFVSHSKLNW